MIFLSKLIKKSFTLFELLVVVILVFIVYYFVFSSNLLSQKDTIDKISLNTLKSYLLTFDFEDKIMIKCIEENEYICYIYKDGQMINDLFIKGLFNDTPRVYEYSNEKKRIEFSYLKLDTFEEFNIIFEYSISSDMQGNDLIIETEDKVYIFNSIYNKPFVFENLYDVKEYLENKISEVKDAF